MQITLPSQLRLWINNNRGDLSVPRFIIKVLEHNMSSNTPPDLEKGCNNARETVCNVRQGASKA